METKWESENEECNNGSANHINQQTKKQKANELFLRNNKHKIHKQVIRIKSESMQLKRSKMGKLIGGSEGKMLW